VLSLSHMSGRFWALALLSSGFALLHCGGTVETLPADASGGAAAHAGRSGPAGSSATAGQGAGGSSSVPLDAAFDEYTDPGCPDAGPPSQVDQCDAFATTPTCPLGEGCYPFVDHPFGEGCGAQSFGTVCMLAGTGHQGDICGDGTQDCASGFVCVVGSQPGMRCVQLCHLDDQNSCPPGMICGELDVEGYGVCS
jgi:hypothetical protein